MNKKYESVFIIKEDCNEKDIINEIDKIIEGQKAEISRKDELGLKKLAYEIRKNKSVYYYVVYFEITNDNNNPIAKIQKQINTIEEILKFIIVKVDEEAEYE